MLMLSLRQDEAINQIFVLTDIIHVELKWYRTRKTRLFRNVKFANHMGILKVTVQENPDLFKVQEVTELQIMSNRTTHYLNVEIVEKIIRQTTEDA